MGSWNGLPFRSAWPACCCLVACIALNFWLFRLGVFWGILGLNVTKHVLIAYLCEVMGVDRRRPSSPPRSCRCVPPVYRVRDQSR